MNDINMDSKHNKIYPAVHVLFMLINILYVPYLWLRCSYTHSSFYCSYFEFPLIIPLYGISAFILIVITLISWMTNKKLGQVVRVALLIVAMIIFAFPWIVIINDTIKKNKPLTYSQWLIKSENNQNKETLNFNNCELYKKYLSARKAGDSLLTPSSFGCY